MTIYMTFTLAMHMFGKFIAVQSTSVANNCPTYLELMQLTHNLGRISWDCGMK